MDSNQDPEVVQLKQNISKLLMGCKSDQHVSSAINWLDNIVCQFKSTYNIVFNTENFDDTFLFPKEFLSLVNLEFPQTLLKAIPWIDMKLCEARVMNTVVLDDGNSLMDPTWVQKWHNFEQNPMDRSHMEEKWSTLVMTVTNILVDAGDDLPEVIEWLEKRVAVFKIGGGSFEGTSDRVVRCEETFNEVIKDVSSHLLMIFMLWVDHKLAENRITNEFTFDTEVGLYTPEWLKIIHGKTTVEPVLGVPPSRPTQYNDFLSPTAQREYFDIQKDLNFFDDMPIQKLPILCQTLSSKDARSLGLLSHHQPTQVSVKLKKTSPQPVPSFLTIIHSNKANQPEEYVCPHCSVKMTMEMLNQHLMEHGISYEWAKVGDQLSVIIAEDSDGEDKKMEIPVLQVSTQTTFKLERHLFPPLKKFTPAVAAKAFDGRRVVSESVLKKLEKARSMRKFGKRRKVSSSEEEADEYGTLVTPGGEEELSPIPSNKSHLNALKAVSRGTRSRPSRGIPKFASSEEEEEEEVRKERKVKKKKGKNHDSDSSVSIEFSSETSESIDERPKRRKSRRVEKVSESDEGTYPCPYCDAKFEEPGVLGQHLFDHVYPNKRKGNAVSEDNS